MDELRSLFDRTTEGVAVPPGDLVAVAGSARSIRRRRLVTGVAAAMILLAAGGTGAWILGGQDARPVPAPAGGDGLRMRLVPVIVDGPSPPSDLAPAERRADARAVAVAFHALLDVSARPWLFGYEDVERVDGGRRVRFVQGVPASSLTRRLRQLEVEVGGAEARVSAERLELVRLAERLQASLRKVRGEKARTLRRNLRDVRRRVQEMTAEERELARKIAAIDERQAEVRERAPGWTVELTVAERDGVVVVEDVATDSPDATVLRGAAGYAEALDQVDSWGADYFDPVFRRSDSGSVRVAVRFFWTGPLSSPYEEQCRPQVLTRTGDVVWTMPRPNYPPGVPDHYDSAPPSEDRRDGGGLSFGVDYRGDVDALTLSMSCDWRLRR